MADSANQIERERVYRFIETVGAIRDGRAQGVALAEYWPGEIANAIQYRKLPPSLRGLQSCAPTVRGRSCTERSLHGDCCEHARATVSLQ